MKFLKIRLLVYVVAAIALCCLMEGAGLIIAMTLMVMVMDWAGTSWYFLNRRAEAGDEKSRLKLEKVKKVVDNLWLNLSVFFLLWGIFALITHCSGKAFIGVTAFCVLGAALTVYNHVNKKKIMN